MEDYEDMTREECLVVLKRKEIEIKRACRRVQPNKWLIQHLKIESFTIELCIKNKSP